MTARLSAPRLRCGTSVAALGLATLAAALPLSASAQDATAAPAPAPTSQTTPADPADLQVAAQANGQAAGAQPAASGAPADIVVTGTLFRRTDRETPSPVTVLTATDLANRGINTITDAVQSLAANNGSNLPTAFSANGAFAAGASGVSLRGLTTNSTLVLFDGLRAADYPLADDGVRSFVDLNTIPDAIIDRVEVLKDGASATYGADAIAGVVNLIIKKQITGFQGTMEGGLSQKKDAGEQHLALTYGYGDLQTQGFNVYVSGEYQHDSMLFNRDRGFPYNTNDLSRMMADDGTTPDANTNASATGVDVHYNSNSAVVTPATERVPGNIFTGSALSGALTQVLNPAGCGPSTIQHSDATGSYCEQDNVKDYGVLQPEQTRFGVTAHATVALGADSQAYLMGTYYQNRVYYTGEPEGTRASQPSTVRYTVLPAILRDGSINPQDPFANIIDPTTGQRESALLNYQFGGIQQTNEDLARTYRVAGGVNGTFGTGWSYSLDGTWMHSRVTQTTNGLLNYDALQDAIETGSYNFIDPAANSQAQLDALSPTIKGHSSSDLWQVQGVVSKDLMQLPGGALKAGVGGQVRYEKINDPVQDPLDPNGGYSPYTTVNINLFSAQGHRYNEAAFFEIDAPILDQLEINATGRYDHYSSHFSHFSPKVGVKVTPVKQIALRGTFSKGFRAPSIPETSGQVIGYVQATPPADVAAAHGNDTYVKQYSLGEFNVGNPNLKPEVSTNFTGGAVFQPVRWLSLTADYYHIKKKNVIEEGPDDGDAISAYYAGTPLPAGYTITPNAPDPAHPDAIPTVDIVSASFVNAASLVTSGIDLSASAQFHTGNVHFTSTIDTTRVFKLNVHTDAGVEHFAGTEGPYANTSDSGTPKWRGNWQNTLEVGKVTVSGTAYYTSGYKGTADDYSGAGTSGDCANAIGLASDGATPERCHVRRFIDVDMVGAYQVTDGLQLYVNVLNVFNARAPFDPNTYGGINYNPAFAQAGVVGRYFRVGAHVKL